MWKIVIVDDEKIIRRGLKQYIEESSYPFEVIGEAKSAGEALQQLENAQADVCLVDINMPNMNGLDMISLMKERYSSVVVIVSGYDNFEYARQAVQLQAFDYVLKPVPKSDLNKLLFRLDEHLQMKYPERRHSRRETKELEQPTFTGDGTVLVNKVTEYINDHYQDPELSISRVASLFHINPTYLSKRMKQEIGLSFLDYVTELRIAKAKEILDDVTSNIKIGNLAIKVGYKSQYYFSRVFKNRVGLSPLDYKKGYPGG
ncbi:Helix-turn-helix domain-containing protein [Fontibacillus panacisegetis]|uniref:Helix-turn-helix domain-containing protein n=1 Tax=Fontibacillus panacisegetis TaxID=670482 RepID=A0A1G7LU17_9BACL|nr:response regulator [Fontibacillus panacisegetis]SDF52866.1 Helix-turn-helix domain-containing protein [Fontibacillus panacisegetis]